jgi:hypothetical protein
VYVDVVGSCPVGNWSLRASLSWSWRVVRSVAEREGFIDTPGLILTGLVSRSVFMGIPMGR